MDVSGASLVPSRVPDAAQARAAVAADGAAIMTGLRDQHAAISFGRAMLGDKCVRVGTQFEATKSQSDREASVVDEQPADERGRKRRFTGSQERMVAHNDGFGFGDFAPDFLFLWCERPDPRGGDSFLVDGLKLLRILAAEPGYEEFVSFCWEADIDHSEPGFPHATCAPIARRLASGRAQVRNQPFLAPLPSADEDRQWPLVRRWGDLVAAARDTGPMFRVRPGEMICIDNYRMLHGRDSFTDPARKVLSIWGWSTDAVAVPEGPLDIVRPTAPRAVSR
jgi:hypothetical protein